MDKLPEKFLILVICVILYVRSFEDLYFIVPVILCIFLSALMSYFSEEKIKLAVFLVYLGLCIYRPGFCFFLPLFCYDIAATQRQWLALALLLPFGMNYGKLADVGLVLVLPFSAAAFFMKCRTVLLEKMKAEYTTMRDNAKELELRLESRNNELLEKQDYEVNLAMLKERNRIAREIHDNVGHSLSSSILQIGALMAVCGEPDVKNGLIILKDTLSQSMDNIRNSVHNLHETSIDLCSEVNGLVKSFTKCPVELHYDIEGNPEKKYKYAFIAIIKEALANIIKHSDAAAASITLREHPALYQLVVSDNGSKKELAAGDGLGLTSIEDRVKSLGGILNISTEKGFKIFITIPKEQMNENSNS